MKKFVQVLFVSGALVFAGGAWACQVAGHNKHVGEVTQVDKAAGTFTIHDLEADAPITFQASKDVLKDAARAKGQVMVSYEKKGDALQAKDIHF